MMLVNGKDSNSVLRELYASTPVNVTYDSAKAVFDRILGSHYSIKYSKITVLQTKLAENIIINCRITIFDDNGNMVTYKESYASMEILYTQESKPANFTTAIIRCEKEAFRICCSFFFASKGLQKKEEPNQTRSKTNNEQPISQNQNGWKVVLQTGFVPFSGYKNTYSASAKLMDGTEVMLIIWHKVSMELESSGTLESLLSECKPQMVIYVSGKKNFYKGSIQIAVESITKG